MFYHHNSIRTYVGALLNLFRDLEVQYEKSNGELISKNIKVEFSNREKSKILDEHTVEQITSGNYNVLPRGNLLWSAMVKSDNRTTNKHVKVNTKANENNFEFLYNSVPYEFMFELAIICRGMNEATMIIEQVAAKFNPIINIDVYDAINLSSPTRIPVTLLDIGISTDDYEEISNNIITISFGLSIKGNVYPPIKSIERIKEFKMILSETEKNIEKNPSNINQDKFKKSVISGDVIEMELNDINIFIPEIEDTSPVLIEIISNNIVIGNNDIYCIWEDKDSTIRELTFNWQVISGDATITGNKDKANLIVNSAGEVEVMLTITDEEDNYTSLNKIFNIF